MDQKSSISELVARINENATKVEHHLQSNNLALPSFLPGGPIDMVMKAKDVEDARLAAICTATELLHLLQGPVACLEPSMSATSLLAIYRWDIAKKVPINGEIAFSDLAHTVKMSEPSLRRIIRYAIVWHRIFREPRPGFVSHSAASQLLIDDGPMLDAFGVMWEETAPASTRTCDALQEYGSEDMTRTGYALAHCPGQTMWEHYKDYPTKGKRFASAMKAWENSEGNSISSLVSGYPWSSLPEGSTIIDVGGSLGHASIAISEANPSLKFVVQDLPEVIKEARDIPQDASSRIEFVEYDFREPQTREGDVYLFRWIFHDWPDTWVVQILRNMIPVMKHGTKIVVNDQLIPSPGSSSYVAEKRLRFYDLLMMTLFNSREREKSDWDSLFREADQRFRNINIWTPPGSALSIIEATWIS